jgi:nucleotide-binding universal stress UspA family protein
MMEESHRGADGSPAGRARNGETSPVSPPVRARRERAHEWEIAMGFKTILVPIEQHDLMNSTLQTALLLARKFDSYIEGFALRVEFSAVFAVGDVGAVPIPALEQDIADNEQRSRSLFENFMHEHGVPRAGDTKALSTGWLENAPKGDPFVGSHGRVFDVIVLGRPGRDPKGPRMTTLEASLFESGRPVLIAPPSPQPQMGTNVLIAWNCSTEQARATAFAMPILKRASRVIVLTVEGGAAVPGPTGQQLCRYLQLNGVPAKPLTVGLDDRVTGEAILAHAKALGCDLLIKGAYTQSRLRQIIFGGTTRYILSHAELPVLMAH